MRLDIVRKDKLNSKEKGIIVTYQAYYKPLGLLTFFEHHIEAVPNLIQLDIEKQIIELKEPLKKYFSIKKFSRFENIDTYIVTPKIRTQENSDHRKEAKPLSKEGINEKVIFISKLLKLSTQNQTDERTRDRLINLISDEIGRSSLSREEVERIVEEKIGFTERNHAVSPDAPVRIKETEKGLIKLNEERTLPHKSGKEQKSIPEPNPKHVADFMSLFNKRDGLKYLTHDYDENEEFEIDKFLDAAKEIFSESTKRKQLNIPKSLWSIVNQFAFESEQTEWTSLSEDYTKSIPIKIGWATKELRDWSKRNKLHPIRNEEYSSIINDFKRITRIEPPNLEKLIDIILDNIFKKDLDKYVFEKPGLSKADFYSHVIFLKDALEAIFEEIKKRSDLPQKKKISIQYERSISDEGYYLRKIIITHYNSFPSKELKLVLKEWQEKGNMGKIKEKLRGYCHWSVETIIQEKPTRVNILRDKETPLYESIQSKPNGFTHILTFYYR